MNSIFNNVLNIINGDRNLLRLKGNIIAYNNLLILTPFYDHDDIKLLRFKGSMQFLGNENNFDLIVDINNNNLEVISDKIQGPLIKVKPFGYISPCIMPSIEMDMPPFCILYKLGWRFIVIKFKYESNNMLFFSLKLSDKAEYDDFTNNIDLLKDPTDDLFISNIAKVRNKYINKIMNGGYNLWRK